MGQPRLSLSLVAPWLFRKYFGALFYGFRRIPCPFRPTPARLRLAV